MRTHNTLCVLKPCMGINFLLNRQDIRIFLCYQQKGRTHSEKYLKIY